MTRQIILLSCILPLFALCVTPTHAEGVWQTTASGLKYQVVAKGKGPQAENGNVVVVHYTGTLTNGTQFDSSRGRTPFRFTLGQGGVIAGWDEGVALMQVGSRYKFHIPWKLAYGAAGRPPTIPAKADLLFDIELLELIKPLRFARPQGEKVKTLKGGTRYQVVTPGNGGRPQPEQGVSLRMALFDAGGGLIFSTDENGQLMGGQLKGLTVAGQELPFLRPLISQMCIGEQVTAEVAADQGFGAKSPDPRRIPATGNTYWVIELQSINEIPAFVMPSPDALKTTASGLQYEVVKAGTGRRPTRNDGVAVMYTGWLTDGTLFDSGHARGAPTTFPVNRVVPGWTEGLQLMKEGAIYRFVIPSKLAYGAGGAGELIKPNATLVFLVELVRIEK